MDHFHLIILFLCLLSLIFISAFFSAAETGMMAINRYRLRHLARKGNKAAQRVSGLLERTDRLLGMILSGNTFANILASSIATVIAVQLYGEVGVVVATILLTLIILIFAEITPKTLAALHPQPLAFAVSIPLKLLQYILYPLVWVTSSISNGLLRLFGVKFSRKRAVEQLSSEELRTVVHEAGTRIPAKYQDMLLSIFDLANVTVDDIMIPRNEVVGVDLHDDWEDIIEQISQSDYTRLPVYRGDINDIQGVLHLRKLALWQNREHLSLETLLEIMDEPYFIPEGTPLNKQLVNFQNNKCRFGLVVDEYGDVQGLTTLEDILEEIVGEFTTDLADVGKDIHPQPDGSFLVDGSIALRDLNRNLGLELPTDGPKTLSGLIIEYLEIIPNHATCLRFYNIKLEVIRIHDNMVKTVKIYPDKAITLSAS